MHTDIHALFARYCAIDHDAIDPSTDPNAFEDSLALQDELFATLGLPRTNHNVLRIYTWASDGGTLEDFLADIDAPLPHELLTSESALTVAITEYGGRRGVDLDDDHARAMLACALLAYSSHTYNLDIITAWWSGRMPFDDMMAALTNDSDFLGAAGAARIAAEALLEDAVGDTDLALAAAAQLRASKACPRGDELIALLKRHVDPQAPEDVCRIASSHLGFAPIAQLLTGAEDEERRVGCVLMMVDPLSHVMGLHLILRGHVVASTTLPTDLDGVESSPSPEVRAELADQLTEFLSTADVPDEGPFLVHPYLDFGYLAWAVERGLGVAYDPWTSLQRAIEVINGGCPEEGFACLDEQLAAVERELAELGDGEAHSGMAHFRLAVIVSRARLQADYGRAIEAYRALREVLPAASLWRHAEVAVETVAEVLGLDLIEVTRAMLECDRATPGMWARLGWQLLHLGGAPEEVAALVLRACSQFSAHQLSTATSDLQPASTADQAFLEHGGYVELLEELRRRAAEAESAPPERGVGLTGRLDLVLEAMSAAPLTEGPEPPIADIVGRRDLPDWARERLAAWGARTVCTSAAQRARAHFHDEVRDEPLLTPEFLMWSGIHRALRRVRTMTVMTAWTLARTDAPGTPRERVDALLTANDLGADPVALEVIVYRSNVDHEALYVDDIASVDFAGWQAVQSFGAVDVIRHDGAMTDALASAIRARLDAAGFTVAEEDLTACQLHLHLDRFDA